MVIPDAMFQGFDKTLVVDVVEMGLQVGFLNIQEAIRVVVCSTMNQQVVNRKSALASRWNEYDDRFGR